MLRVVWRGWEGYLQRAERTACSIVTPSKAPPDYDQYYWEDFLEYQGYQPINGHLWQKQIPRAFDLRDLLISA